MFVNMEIKAKKWGNSLGVRIPKLLAEQIGIHDGSSIDITVVDGEIRLNRKSAKLESLLENVSKDNLHGETFNDQVTGQEVW